MSSTNLPSPRGFNIVKEVDDYDSSVMYRFRIDTYSSYKLFDVNEMPADFYELVEPMVFEEGIERLIVETEKAIANYRKSQELKEKGANE